MIRSVPREIEAQVLRRDGNTCQMCGFGPRDDDPYRPGHNVIVTIRHIVDKSLGGGDEPDNLRVVCTNCNEGLQNISPPKPDRLQLMGQLRRATVADQRHALEWLEQKFKAERERQ